MQVATSLLLFAAVVSGCARGRQEAVRCYRLDEAPGWAFGAKGDVLCLDAAHFVVLLSDGSWDGWPVRWGSNALDAGARRALATGSAALERADIHWDLGSDSAGKPWLERPGGLRVPLTALDGQEAEVARG